MPRSIRNHAKRAAWRLRRGTHTEARQPPSAPSAVRFDPSTDATRRSSGCGESTTVTLGQTEARPVGGDDPLAEAPKNTPLDGSHSGCIIYTVTHTYKYPRPALTVDAVVFGVDAGALKLLLIERGEAPFKGQWALPGGFVHMNESLDAAALRELSEETGLSIVPAHLEQLYTFGDPARDPRGRVISVAYMALVRLSELKAASDATDAQWFAVDELPRLAFDHWEIIRAAKRRLRAKVRYAPVGFDLLPREFSLVDLQRLYELLLGHGVDKGNFRKKVLGMGLLRDTGRKNDADRPAQLYQFDAAEYERLTRRGFNFEI